MPSVGEVVRREAAVIEAIDVGAEVKQATDQRRVLDVHREMECRPTAALLLSTQMNVVTSLRCSKLRELVAANFELDDTHLRVDIGAQPN